MVSTDHEGVFWDAEESQFYALSLRIFLRDTSFVVGSSHRLVELGVGTGRPMLEVLKDSDLDIHVTGYDINERAVRFATELAQSNGIGDRFKIIHGDFFDHDPDEHSIAVSNPPYIPAPDSDDMPLPELWAGIEGTAFTSALLDGGYERLVVMLSSYSNPLAVIEQAKQRGYSVANFMLKTIAFGQWSKQEKVRRHIDYLVSQNKAFVQDDRYCLAAVAWTKDSETSDVTPVLARAIQSASNQFSGGEGLRNQPLGLRRIK